MSDLETGSSNHGLLDQRLIEEQVQRLTRHALFQQSKHLAPFLAYIVRVALDPKSDGLLKNER